MGSDSVQKVILQKEVSGLVLGLWRKQLKARVFHVSGSMVFKMDESTYKELPRKDEGEFWARYDQKGGGS